MIEKLMLNLVGYCVFAGLMYRIGKANARRWNRLAAAYRAPAGIKCAAECTMQTVILVGGHVGWNSYKGIVSVGVTEEGILLRLMLPFSFFHPPLLLPYGDNQIEPRKWYLVGKTSQLTLRKVGNVQVIIHDELLQWIESQVTGLANLAGVPE
jgi:hypothetical protein